MKKKEANKSDIESTTELRQRAEKELKSRTHGRGELDSAYKDNLIHELEVHQIELEMQNEDLRRAQQEAQESRSRYLDLFDFAPVGYLVMDDHFLILEANLTGSRMLGLERNKLTGQRFSHFIVPAFQDDFHHFMVSSPAIGEQPLELQMQKTNGTAFYAELRILTLKISGKNPLYRVAITDISHRKQAEEALQQATQKYMGLFNNKIVGLAYCETVFDEYNQPVDYIILDVNPTYEALMGIKRENIVGKKITEAAPGIAQDLIDRHNRVAITGEETRFEIYEPVNAKWYDEDVFSPQRGYFISLFSDITERKLMEARLAAQDRLAYLGRMAGTLAHEVRNPLSVIDSSVFYIEKRLKDSDDKIKEHLQRMRRGVTRTKDIIEKLLEMSRMKEPVLKPTNLAKSIRYIITQVKIPYNIKLNFNSNEDIIIPIDKQQFDMALGNIIKNAIESMADGGTLNIDVSENGNNIEIKIKDAGYGIPKENMSRLFDPLFTTKPGGVGFGLALAKTVIDRHGGKIGVESEMGKGTTFTIILPLPVKDLKE